MENNMKNRLLGHETLIERGEIWQQKGYCSTDCGEDNDDNAADKKAAGGDSGVPQLVAADATGDGGDEDEEYEYYDEEEDEAEESKADPSDPQQVIEREREERKVPEEERKLIAQMSDIERSIVAKQEKAAREKKAASKVKDFSWWRYDDP